MLFFIKKKVFMLFEFEYEFFWSFFILIFLCMYYLIIEGGEGDMYMLR